MRLSLACLLAAAAPSYALQARPETVSFVSLMGVDTMAIEQFTRTPRRLEGEVIDRMGAAVTRFRYDVALDASSQPTRISYRLLDQDGIVRRAWPSEIRLTVVGDSIRREAVWADSIQLRAFAAPRPAPGRAGLVASAPFSVTAGAVAQAAARDSIHIATGDPSRPPRCGRAETDTFDLVQVVGATTRVASRIVTSVKEARIDRTLRCLVVHRYLAQGHTAFDSSVVNTSTLEPIAYIANLDGVRHDVEFYPGWVRVRSDSLRRVSNDSIDVALGAFNDAVESLVFRSLPLAPRRIIVYDILQAPRRPNVVRIEVLGIDTVVTRGQRVPAWRLAHNLLEGRVATTVWLAVGSQMPLRYLNTLPSGNRIWRLKPGDAP